MASTTASHAPLHAVPAAGTTSTAAVAPRTWVGPAVAAAIGSFSAVLATWAIVATQTLHMSL